MIAHRAVIALWSLAPVGPGRDRDDPKPGPPGVQSLVCGVDRDDRRRLPLKTNTLTAWRDTRVVEPRGGRACAARALVITDVMPLRVALAISGTEPDPAISGVALQAAIFAAARLFGDSCCSPWAGRCFRASRSSARHPWVRRGSEGPQFPHAESGRPMCRGRVRGLARARLADRGRERATCLTAVFGDDLVALLLVFRSTISGTPAADGVAMAEAESDITGAMKRARCIQSPLETHESESQQSRSCSWTRRSAWRAPGGARRRWPHHRTGTKVRLERDCQARPGCRPILSP